VNEQRATPDMHADRGTRDVRARPGEYLVFSVASLAFAVPILGVREIVEYQRPTRIPTTPDAIAGVVNLRGRVLPVVDLAAKLGLAPEAAGWKTCIVVLDVAWPGELTRLGVLADEVQSTLELGPSEIAPPPDFGAPVRLEFLAGVGKSDSELVLLLDVERTLSREELTRAAELEASPFPIDTKGEGADVLHARRPSEGAP
jgi:purine-binding chemotaxis protein CheW